MYKIVCRHLDIGEHERHTQASESLPGVDLLMLAALSTSRDIKRIHKAKAGSAVIEKLVLCSQQNGDHINVAGGILMAMRKCVKDGILASQMYSRG